MCVLYVAVLNKHHQGEMHCQNSPNEGQIQIDFLMWIEVVEPGSSSTTQDGISLLGYL
jgi:hypothetical protein